jgi:hypothetical protein
VNDPCPDIPVGSLPGQPFLERVSDPKILERLLEWARTADDKASRFALLALGLSFFWIYYAALVPFTAAARQQSLDHDLLTLAALHSRLADVQARLRSVATAQRKRSAQVSQQPFPFFVDVMLQRLANDPRITLRPDERNAARSLRSNLAYLSVLIERCRAFSQRNNGSADALRKGDPSEVLVDLDRTEGVMFQLQNLNTQARNSEWLEAVEPTLASDGEQVLLGSTITATLAPYETLVGEWAAPDRTTPIGAYREIALRNGERPPATLQELRALQDKLKTLRDEAESDLRLRRLRIPFTEIQIDRRLFLAIGPVAVTLLYHYLLIYLVLARQIEIFITTLWGDLAAHIAATLRPSDALFRSFDDCLPVPALVRAVRRPVRWFTHSVLILVPVVLVLTAAAVSMENNSAGIRVLVAGLALLCGSYATLLAYGLWKLR